MTAIAIDCRMMFSSGIGTYLQHFVPIFIQRRPDWSFQLLGDVERLSSFEWSVAKNVELIDFTAKIYSIKEQVQFPVEKIKDADVLWCPNYNIPLRWRGIKLVTVNDVAHLALPEIYGGVLKTLYAKTMLNAVKRMADEIIYISNFSKTEFNTRVGIPTCNENVVYCGVGEEWFLDKPDHSGAETSYFVFVGNVKPHKNLQRLLDAFALIMDDVPHQLKIIGKREGFITGDHSVQEQIEKFGDRILFTGFVDDDTLKQIIGNAEALVLPSMYEGFGLPPVEAMAAKCPTLVANAASMPEVCQDAALYCDPYDVFDIAKQLKLLLTDTALQDQLRKRGVQRAKELDWASAAQEYLEIFSRLTMAA